MKNFTLSPSRSFTLFSVLVTAALATSLAAQEPSPPQVFRAGTSVVPLDVRVVDRTGKPVTDLREDEFIVTENGRRQAIRHFFAQAFTPMPALVNAAGADDILKLRTAESTGIEPQHRRVFVLVMGRGLLQGPAKGVDGALQFVRERLLPQDVVAAMAWNRTTEFTTDHASLAEVLERFKRKHQEIEMKLNLAMGGLAAIYGSREIPPAIQKDIDEVFGGPSRSIGPQASPNDNRLRADRDRLIGDLRDAARDDPGNNNDLELDEFVQASAQSMQDLGRLYAAIDYLRRFEGEKQVVFVSERGIRLPRAEDDKDLAGIAASARVVVNFIHTDGVSMDGLTLPARAYSASQKGLAGRAMAPLAVMRSMSWARQTAGQVSVLTGGQPSIGRMAKDAFAAIDSSSRFQYLLGYYPTNTAQDQRLRQIRVTVSRPGVSVFYRHGYSATPPTTPLDRREMLTYTRVVAAANYAGPVADIGIRGTATASKLPAAPAVQLEFTIDPSRVVFQKTNHRNTAELELLVGCVDGRDNILHQTWKRVELAYTDERLAAVKQSGVPVSMPLPLNGLASAAKNVKVVVYDYAADLVGSAIIKVQ